MRFSVGIASIRGATLGAAVRSVVAQTFTDFEVIVVGQGDHTTLRATVAAAAGDDPRVRYESLPARGLSLARNRILGLARGEVVAFTDDDCEAPAGWLAALATGFDAHPDVGLVAGPVAAPRLPAFRIATCPSLTVADALYDPVASDRTAPAGWDWIGANFALRAQVAARIGAFDPNLGAGTRFGAGEDTDYKLRLEAAGVRMLTSTAALVRHSGGVRHGLRAALASQRAYASGNGALAAKQTLGGDPRGAAWLAATRAECLAVWSRRPPRAVSALRRYRLFRRAYESCLDGYELADGILSQRPAPAARVSTPPEMA
ncbi:MAG: glycosyltransferase [Candidatus Dormibacteraeota bacterium]|nr:glycosyltransferase [Candidatus Dormibacteraeota bacterium]